MLTGDPGKAKLFDDFGVYSRGAMTLHALRNVIGDEAFFKLVKEWPKRRWHGHGTLKQFQAAAAEIGDKDLGAFFKTWLFTPAKPKPSADNGVKTERSADMTRASEAPRLSARPHHRER